MAERVLQALKGSNMVRPEDILQLLRTRPFQPFRVVLMDGKHYDIHYHQNNIVYQWALSIGIPKKGMEESIADHVELIMLDQIDRVETIFVPAQQAS
jgi:hypothetical protein